MNGAIFDLRNVQTNNLYCNRQSVPSLIFLPSGGSFVCSRERWSMTARSGCGRSSSRVDQGRVLTLPKLEILRLVQIWTALHLVFRFGDPLRKSSAICYLLSLASFFPSPSFFCVRSFCGCLGVCEDCTFLPFLFFFLFLLGFPIFLVLSCDFCRSIE